MKVFQPSITYAMPVWGGVNQAELFKTLERQHCRAARISFGFPADMPTVDVLAIVEWNTLTYMCHNVLNSFACMLQCNLCSFNVVYYSGKVL